MIGTMIEVLKTSYLIFCAVSAILLISFAMPSIGVIQKIIGIIWLISFLVLAIVMIVGLALEWMTI